MYLNSAAVEILSKSKMYKPSLKITMFVHGKKSDLTPYFDYMCFRCVLQKHLFHPLVPYGLKLAVRTEWYAYKTFLVHFQLKFSFT